MRQAMAFVLFCLCLQAQAQEPIIVPLGGYADKTITVPEGASVIYRFSEKPVQRSTGLPPGRLVFGGVPGKTYTVTVLIVDFKNEKVIDTDYVFQFTGGAVTPPVPVPPVPVPPVPGNTYYFMVIRPDGPAAPAFTNAMSLEQWAVLRTKGHKVKDFTATQAKNLGVNIPAASLPVVVTLREDTTTGRSTIVRGAIALPTTGDAVLALEKVP